jgi:hypothetical protein
MDPAVNAIANRLSLRQPQRDSLEILARVCEIAPVEKGAEPGKALEIIRSEFPTVAPSSTIWCCSWTSRTATARRPAFGPSTSLSPSWVWS